MTYRMFLAVTHWLFFLPAQVRDGVGLAATHWLRAFWVAEVFGKTSHLIGRFVFFAGGVIFVDKIFGGSKIVLSLSPYEFE